MRAIRRIRLDGQPAIECLARFPHRTPMVWEAAVEPEGLSRWFPARVDYERFPGGRITFSGDANLADHEGRLTEYEPGHRIAFTWGASEVRMVLTSIDGTTDFTLVDRLAHQNEAARNAAGWHERIAILERRLDVPVPVRPWHELYAHYVNAGFPTGAHVPADALSAADAADGATR